MAVKDYLNLGMKPWEEARGELNSWLTRLSQRLDAQEGRAGTPKFYSGLDLGGHALTNGPASLSPVATDYITKGYADTVYGPQIIRLALQVSGSHPLPVNDLLGGTFITGGVANFIPKFDSANSLTISSIEDNGIGTTMSIHASGNVSIGSTADNGYGLEVTGSMNVTSAITALSFTGLGPGLSALNASLISNGTLDSARLDSDVVRYAGSSMAGNINVNSGYGLAHGTTSFACASAAEIYQSSTKVLAITTSNTEMYIDGSMYTLTVVAGIVNAT